MKEFIGETLGTFVMVLFGCGSVAVATLFGEYNGILQIAVVWGIGVTLAIYLTRHLSCAHLNPAVSLSMAFGKRMNPKKLPKYLLGQFLGAFLAGAMVLLLFGPSISNFEMVQGIVRGSEESVQTAKMFGEFYSKPGVTMPLAIFAETFGTFLLVLLIFALTEGCNVGRPSSTIAPLFIGLTVTSIICLVAPLTQAGLNPARDFGPRIVAWLAGWGSSAFPDSKGGFFWVYMVGPVFGGIMASLFFVRILEPAMKKESVRCNCDKKESEV